jgi:nitric oxide dioxygenase
MIPNPTTIQQLISYSQGGIMSKVLQKSDHSDVTLFCMAQGTEIGEHTASRNALLYVIEGKGIFYLEGEEISMQTGVLISFNKNSKHALQTLDNLSFLLYLSS